MNLSVTLRKAAERDVIAAQVWYERQETGLGSRFRECVDEAIGRLRIAPDRYPYANHRFRRILVRRPFPYTLYFAIEPDRIVVVACLHEKRNVESLLERR